MFAPWRSQNPVRKTWISDYWKIIHCQLSLGYFAPQFLFLHSQQNKFNLNRVVFSSWLYNLFSSQIDRKVKDELNKLVRSYDLLNRNEESQKLGMNKRLFNVMSKRHSELTIMKILTQRTYACDKHMDCSL